MPLERSIPVTAYPALASSTACRPVPQPMSRIDAPSGSSRSSTRNAASRTLSVVKTSFMYCGAKLSKNSRQTSSVMGPSTSDRPILSGVGPQGEAARSRRSGSRYACSPWRRHPRTSGPGAPTTLPPWRACAPSSATRPTRRRCASGCAASTPTDHGLFVAEAAGRRRPARRRRRPRAGGPRGGPVRGAHRPRGGRRRARRGHRLRARRGGRALGARPRASPSCGCG